MTVKLKFVSLPDISRREITINLEEKESLSLDKVLDVVSKEVGVDFKTNKNNYIFMHNSSVIGTKGLNLISVKDMDTIIVMPIIYGG